MTNLFNALKLRRFLCSAAGTCNQMSGRKKLRLALLIFLCSFLTKSLHAIDLVPVMYTDNQPFRNLTQSYHSQTDRIIERGDLLGISEKASDTFRLARAPGYSIYLSVVYSLLSRDFFTAQITQNIINSLSPVILFLVAGLILSWRIGAVAGLLCAVSQHLSIISNLILPDSLCALPILSGVLLLTAARRYHYHPHWLYALAGISFGIACWLRSQNMLLGLFLFLLFVVVYPRRLFPVRQLALMTIISFLVIVPITIRNYLVHREVVLINIGLGMVLWEGIAEAGGRRFGAVATDREVGEQEAIEYGNPEYAKSWAIPDGIERDRKRVKKSLAVMVRNPLFSTKAALSRMERMIKYPSKGAVILPRTPSLSTEIIKQERPRQIKAEWRDIQYSHAPLVIGAAVSFARPLLWLIQQVIRFTAVGALLTGAIILLIACRRRAFLLVAVPLYYLIFQSPMHTEARYTAAMQHFAFILIATGWVVASALVWRWSSEYYRRKIVSRQPIS